MSPKYTYRLQAQAIRLTSKLGRVRQARTLTLLFNLHRVYFQGHVEPWLDFRLKNLPFLYRLLFPFPHVVRQKIWMSLYAFKLFSKGFVYPGIWKLLPDLDIKENVSSENAIEKWPDFILEDLRALSEIEPCLYPDSKFIAQYHNYKVPINEYPGMVFRDIYVSMPKDRYSVIVIAPWVRRGGADKGLLQFLDYYASKVSSVLLITTLPHKSDWLGQVSVGIDVLEIASAIADLARDDQELILARVILEKFPRIVHIINSDLGWAVVEKYARAILSNGSEITASLFTHEIDERGLRHGFAQKYLPYVRLYLSRILCDSEAFCLQISNRFSIPKEKINFVPFYVSDKEDIFSDVKRVSTSVECAPILWAGRICWQKRPDLLFEIASRNERLEFYVYGDPTDAFGRDAVRKLRKLPNVRLMCGYDNFHNTMKHRDFSAFLYTTCFDGTPNVLLEAAFEQIPVVAPVEIGGIGELVTCETGWPVTNSNNPEEFSKQLNNAVVNREDACTRAKKMRDLVVRRHSHENFNFRMDLAVRELIL